VPPEACDRLTGSVGSKDIEDVCLDTGHIGIYVSMKSMKGFTPKIVDWLLERNVAENYTGTCAGSDGERVRSAKKRRVARTGV
jgi:hypothetical protein